VQAIDFAIQMPNPNLNKQTIPIGNPKHKIAQANKINGLNILPPLAHGTFRNNSILLGKQVSDFALILCRKNLSA
jgi:hypothetical protein